MAARIHTTALFAVEVQSVLGGAIQVRVAAENTILEP